MANKDEGGSKSSKTAASKSLKEKRQAKKAKADSFGLHLGKVLTSGRLKVIDASLAGRGCLIEFLVPHHGVATGAPRR